MRITHISTHVTVAIICVAISASLGMPVGTPLAHAAHAGQVCGAVAVNPPQDCVKSGDYRKTLLAQAQKLDLTSAGWRTSDVNAIKAIALLMLRSRGCSEPQTPHRIQELIDEARIDEPRPRARQ